MENLQAEVCTVIMPEEHQSRLKEDMENLLAPRGFGITFLDDLVMVITPIENFVTRKDTEELADELHKSLGNKITMGVFERSICAVLHAK